MSDEVQWVQYGACLPGDGGIQFTATPKWLQAAFLVGNIRQVSGDDSEWIHLAVKTSDGEIVAGPFAFITRTETGGLEVTPGDEMAMRSH